MLAQYTEKDGLSLGGLFNGLKVNTKDFEDIINKFKQIEDFDKYLDNGVINWDDLSKSIGITDTRLLSYFKTLDDGKGHIDNTSASVEGMSAYLEKSGNGFQFAAIKATLLNTALNAGIFLVASVAIQGIAKALDNYIHRLDNAKEALSSTQSELSSVNDELKDTTDKIAELEALDPSSLSITDKEDLQRLKDQNEELRIRQKYLEDQEKYDLQKVADLTKEKYGQKYGNVNRDKVDEYRSLYNNKETKTTQASSYLIGGTSSQSTPYAASKQSADVMRGSGTLADLIAQYEYYLKLKKEAVQSNDAEGIKQYEDKLTEIANELRDDRTELQGFSDDLKAAGDTSNELDNITWQLKAIDDLLLSPGQNLVNFLDKDILAEDKQKLVELADTGKLTQDELSSNFSEVDKYLKENGLTLEDLISVVKTYKEEMADTFADETGISPISISQTIDQLNTQLKPAFDSLNSAWNDIFSDDEFKLNSIDILSTCDSIKSKMDEMKELGLDVDYSAFENFVNVLNNTESKTSDVDKAFDSLADSIAKAALTGAEDFDTMKAALEDLGVVNSEMVAFDNLISKTNALADAGIDLVKATETEMQAFVDESVSAEYAGEALALLHLKKALVNQEILTTASDCQNILDLATAANIGIAYLEQLNTLMNLITKRDAAHASGDSRAVLELNRAIRDFSANIVNNLNLEGLQVDFSGIGKGAKSAGSKAGKDYKEALKEQLSDLDSVISGITSRIDDQISVINEQKSAALESIDAQKEALEDAKDAAVEALEAERDARLEVIETQKAQLEEQIKLIDKQIKAKQDEIKSIEDAAESRAREISLQEKQYALEQKRNQRTKLVYTESSGMIYRPDEQGIRKAKEEVDDAKRQIEIANIQKEIDLLEDQKDLLNEQIDLLDERADAINKYYDEQIKQTEKFYDAHIKTLEKQRKETEAYYESITKSLEQRKDKFQELTEILEKAELSAKLKQLGIDEEALLNGSEEEFNKLKDAYMNIVFQLNEGNDEVLNSLRELSGYEGSAPAMLEDSNTKLGTMNDELGTANTEVGNVNSALDKTATTTGNVATNVSDVNTNIGETTGLVNEQKGAFDELKQTIDLIVEAINQKIQAIEAEQSTVANVVGSEMANFQLLINKILEVKESLDAVNDTVATMDRQPIDNLTNAFQLFYDKLILVSNLLGVGMEGEGEGAVSGITGAIQALNEISLEEGIIAQFTMLKEAIDSVTAAISGGGGESSEGEGSGSGSGSKGGKTGGKGSEGKGKGESGGGNSLTGAIKEMGETAKEVIGEPDAEGDGTVIGEFGSMETAVNDVRDAIGTEGSERGEGGNSGGETDDTLVGSIEYLGDKTEEEMGESGGDGIISRFEEFRDVIGEADDHVQSINTGLDEIDGKEVSCTIHVNIETSGSTGFTGSAQVLGSMNLNSATYNAQYKGNAHYEGTAEVTGDWGVKKGGTTLVGELGQEIVVFPNGRFKTVGDNGAEFVDIPANSIVFNHLQTKELLSKGNIVGRGRALASGTALANGTDDTIWTTLADGTKVRELQPGDRMYDMMQKFDAYFQSMDGNLEKLVPNSVYDHQRQMEDMAKQITNNSIVNNTRNVQQPITIQVGDINLTGVQDVNGLAQAIKTRLPNAMLQEMHRR